MSPLAIVLALAAAAGAAPAPTPKPAAKASTRAAPVEAPWTEDERAFCAAELDGLARRTHLFEVQGLARAEIARRNADASDRVGECRQCFVVEQRRRREELDDLEELDRRGGSSATPLDRDRLWRQIRRERLSGKSPAALTAEERVELQGGLPDEVRETHETLDTAHAQDRTFMRQVHSALACYHGDRREDLKAEIGHEESLVKLGTGDRTRVYALRSQLRESEDVLARSREAARAFPEGLLRCGDPQTTVLRHCLGIRFEGKEREPACDSEAIQQYIRFIK